MLSRAEAGVKKSFSISSNDDDAVDIAVCLMFSAQNIHSNSMVYLNHPASSLSGLQVRTPKRPRISMQPHATGEIRTMSIGRRSHETPSANSGKLYSQPDRVALDGAIPIAGIHVVLGR